MPEEFLYAAQVSASGEQVCRECVAQRVRMYALKSSPGGRASNGAAYSLGIKREAGLGALRIRCADELDERGPSLFESHCGNRADPFPPVDAGKSAVRIFPP